MFYEKQHSIEKDYLYFGSRGQTDLNFPMHIHKSFEVVSVFDGEIEVRIENMMFSAKKGQVVLIFPNQPHAYVTRVHSQTRIMLFSEELLRELYREFKGGAVHYPVITYNRQNFIEKIEKSAQNRMRVLSYLYHMASYYTENPPYSGFGQYRDEPIYKFLDYMEEHYRENIKLKDIAASLGYNYRYLSGMINGFFGISFPTLLNQNRTAYAMRLLCDTDASITEISDLSGFDNIRSFNRNFKLIQGLTPKDARKLSSDTPTPPPPAKEQN